MCKIFPNMSGLSLKLSSGFMLTMLNSVHLFKILSGSIFLNVATLSQMMVKASGFTLTNVKTLSRTVVSCPNVQWLHAFNISKTETFLFF